MPPAQACPESPGLKPKPAHIHLLKPNELTNQFIESHAGGATIITKATMPLDSTVTNVAAETSKLAM